MKTLVIQSFRTNDVPAWIQYCLASVKQWCDAQGFTRQFVGDELFDEVPDWYLAKTGKGPIAADYGRLVQLHRALAQEKFDRVIWLDADVVVLDMDMTLASDQSCAFGQEYWIQEEGGILKARKNVHNAVCVFHAGCVVLPFLQATVASIMRRAHPDHIAPQMVGPKLLSALHSLYDFALLPQVGALSPAVAQAVIDGGGPALDLLLDTTPVPLQAINLCASLLSAADADQVLAGLKLLPKGG